MTFLIMLIVLRESKVSMNFRVIYDGLSDMTDLNRPCTENLITFEFLVFNLDPC